MPRLSILAPFVHDEPETLHNVKTRYCYLCGHPLVSDNDKDHVPPRQIFAKDVRRLHNPNLQTVEVHRECNHSFQKDEDYFANSLAPLVQGSYAGNSLLADVFRRVEKGRNLKLVSQLLYEFEFRPSGLVLPAGRVVKRMDGRRIDRVAWKIVRGLFYLEFENFLPGETPHHLQVIAPGDKPPAEFAALGDASSKGRYPGVFDYKHATFDQFHDMQLWAMLFWDRIIMLMAFHDPSCKCDTCEQIREDPLAAPISDD